MIYVMQVHYKKYGAMWWANNEKWGAFLSRCEQSVLI